ncbi:hypothetical protein GCM10027610_024820 [Dactylosporangium cerinum]
MNLLPRELTTGRWGLQLDIGVPGGLLEAASTANDGVQAFAAAHLADYCSNQQLLDAELAGDRGTCVGVKRCTRRKTVTWSTSTPRSIRSSSTSR